MSGIPLAVSDVPVGTVTARVIRGALTNPLPGQTVELAGTGQTRTATTDAAGRATFNGLTPGVRVKAAVVVNGERTESQEFEVPAAGGIRLMLVTSDAATGKASESGGAPASAAAVAGEVVLGEQSRFVIEIGDDALNVFNILQFVNAAKAPVQPAAPLVFELPAGAGGAGLLEGSAPNGVAAGNRVTVSGPFAPGNTLVQFAYSIPLGSAEITVAQKMPVPMTQVSVVAQRIGGMRLSSPQLTGQRDMSADGQTFVVAQGGAVRAGETVALTLTGLPHRAEWPARVALLAAAVILLAGGWAATRGGTPQVTARRGQLQARREKLFSELAALERERRQGTVEARVYAARRESLVTALEDLYAGLEREVA